jgi:hypothetical protein
MDRVEIIVCALKGVNESPRPRSGQMRWMQGYPTVELPLNLDHDEEIS